MAPNSPPQDGPAKDPDSAPRPGGTLLRFKKLTNHLFGLDKKEVEDAADKKGS